MSCHFCSVENAPFGFRLPGIVKEIPEGKRGMMWTCNSKDCRSKAEARIAAYLEKQSPMQRGVAPQVAPKFEDKKQGQLL